MIDLLNWYFYRALKAQFLFIYHILTHFEDFLGLSINIRYYFQPIFNDRSFFGRIMSLIIRSIVIVAGLLIMTLTSLILLGIPLIWIASPIVWIWEKLFLLVPIAGIIYYLSYSRSDAKKIFPHKYPVGTLEDFMDRNTQHFLITEFSSPYFKELLDTPSVTHFLERLSIPKLELTNFLTSAEYNEETLSKYIRQLCNEFKIREIRPIHIFIAHLLILSEKVTPLLQTHKIDIDHIKKYTVWNEHEFNLYNPSHLWDEDYTTPTKGGSNVTWQGTVTPILNQYSRDLTLHVVNNPIRVIRQYLIDEIAQGLQKSMSASVLLVGNIGVGKDKLVEIIAQQINQGAIKGFLWSKRIVQLDIGQLYAGATEKGAFEKRVEDIIEEINRSGNIALYLNDFKSAVEMSDAGTISLLTLLQDPLAKNKLHIIGSITPKQLNDIEGKFPQFIQEFTTIEVTEPNQYETTEILLNEGLIMEQKKQVFLTYPVIEQLYNYANQYIQDDHFPQKGLRLMEETISFSAAQRLGTTWNTMYGPRIPILEEALNTVLSKKLHIDVGETQQSEAQKLLHLEEKFAEKVIGQSEAVQAVAEVLRRNRVGLRNRNKPVGSFLFVGPTGVGKTKMAKVLADEYFGDESRMIRFDMSEFQTEDSIERLLGSQARGTNYLTLTQQLRKQPFSLILLDELEKAHPSILDVFLQVLDDGRLTDAQGETIHCNESIIIATSNAGTQTITDMFSKSSTPTSYETINTEIYHILSKFFRIEFLNRFDDIIVFKPLTPAVIRKIVEQELTTITTQLSDERKITVTFSPEIVTKVVKEGYNPELGARPLERAIQNIIESQLAKEMLEKQIQPGSSITI